MYYKVRKDVFEAVMNYLHKQETVQLLVALKQAEEIKEQAADSSEPLAINSKQKSSKQQAAIG